jgi:hypothetical protein
VGRCCFNSQTLRTGTPRQTWRIVLIIKPFFRNKKKNCSRRQPVPLNSAPKFLGGLQQAPKRASYPDFRRSGPLFRGPTVTARARAKKAPRLAHPLPSVISLIPVSFRSQPFHSFPFLSLPRHRRRSVASSPTSPPCSAASSPTTPPPVASLDVVAAAAAPSRKPPRRHRRSQDLEEKTRSRRSPRREVADRRRRKGKLPRRTTSRACESPGTASFSSTPAVHVPRR